MMMSYLFRLYVSLLEAFLLYIITCASNGAILCDVVVPLPNFLRLQYITRLTSVTCDPPTRMFGMDMDMSF